MEPANAAAEDCAPIEVAGLELRRGLIATVIEDDGRTNAMAAIAVHGGDVGAGDAVVLEMPVERLDTNGTNTLGDQISNGIGDHGRRDAGVQAEAVREIGRDVELTTADMDVAMVRFAEGNDAGVETVDQGPQADKVQGTRFGDVQAVVHCALHIV